MSVFGILAILILAAVLIGVPLLVCNIRAIFCREVNSFFTSPLAYVLMFIFLVAINAPVSYTHLTLPTKRIV